MPAFIHDFANKEETGDFAGFQGFAAKFIGVHTTGSDFGFFITFGSCRCDDPFVNLTLQSFERLIRPISWSVEIEPAHGKRLGRIPCTAERMRDMPRLASNRTTT